MSKDSETFIIEYERRLIDAINEGDKDTEHYLFSTYGVFNENGICILTPKYIAISNYKENIAKCFQRTSILQLLKQGNKFCVNKLFESLNISEVVNYFTPDFLEAVLVVLNDHNHDRIMCANSMGMFPLMTIGMYNAILQSEKYSTPTFDLDKIIPKTFKEEKSSNTSRLRIDKEKDIRRQNFMLKQFDLLPPGLYEFETHPKWWNELVLIYKEYNDLIQEQHVDLKDKRQQNNNWRISCTSLLTLMKATKIYNIHEYDVFKRINIEFFPYKLLFDEPWMNLIKDGYEDYVYRCCDKDDVYKYLLFHLLGVDCSRTFEEVIVLLKFFKFHHFRRDEPLFPILKYDTITYDSNGCTTVSGTRSFYKSERIPNYRSNSHEIDLSYVKYDSIVISELFELFSQSDQYYIISKGLYKFKSTKKCNEWLAKNPTCKTDLTSLKIECPKYDTEDMVKMLAETGFILDSNKFYGYLSFEHILKYSQLMKREWIREWFKDELIELLPESAFKENIDEYSLLPELKRKYFYFINDYDIQEYSKLTYEEQNKYLDSIRVGIVRISNDNQLGSYFCHFAKEHGKYVSEENWKYYLSKRGMIGNETFSPYMLSIIPNEELGRYESKFNISDIITFLDSYPPGELPNKERYINFLHKKLSSCFETWQGVRLSDTGKRLLKCIFKHYSNDVIIDEML